MQLLHCKSQEGVKERICSYDLVWLCVSSCVLAQLLHSYVLTQRIVCAARGLCVLTDCNGLLDTPPPSAPVP